jgi:nitrate reductase gamma subunit
MTATEWLLWARGPAFEIATVILVMGIIVRLIEILMLGRKENLAAPRGSATAGGLRTIVSRSIPDSGTLQRSTFTIVAGYIFHIGLFVVIFLLAPHILVFGKLTGLSWPALPTTIVDAFTVITILSLVAVLVSRLNNKVKRYLSGPMDYIVWALTTLPLITGYMAFHRIGFSGPMLMALHIMSVELLMIAFPFTKLSHAFTLFLARFYNGSVTGIKGV